MTMTFSGGISLRFSPVKIITSFFFADDGLQALAVLRKVRPELILMDIMMPDLNGIETMKRIKTIPQAANVPILMITGKSERAVVNESIEAGAAGFLVKPLGRATLLGKMAGAIRS
jgi:CheY-like chemotaxis protein